MTYDILATGSSGNAVVINGEILIDCGVPMKKLRDSGYIKSLKLVLLTHAHGDHFNAATVRALHQERPALRWGCCEWMVPHLLDAGVDKRVIDVHTPDVCVNHPGFVTLMPFSLIHDVPNCGWRIISCRKMWRADMGEYIEKAEPVFYATDCATLDGIEAKNYSVYLLEANHTRAEIEARIADKQARGEFAYETRAAQNHLSQEHALDWLARNAGPNSQYVFLHQHKGKENSGATKYCHNCGAKMDKEGSLA